MSLKLKNKPKNFYLLILTYITIFIILIVSLISVVFFINFDNFVLSILYSSSKDNLSQISYSADFMIESADTISKQVFFDSSINQLLYNVKENTPEILDSLKRLNNYVSATTNVESIYIYNADQKKFSYAIRNLGSGIETVNNFFDRDVLKNISYNLNTSTSPISRVTGKSEEYPTIGKENVYTFALFNNNNSTIPDGALILNFSADWLYKTINYLDKSPQNTTFIIDNKGIVVSNNIAYPFLKDISNKDFVKHILNASKTSGYFIANINGKRSFITFASSGTINWKFIKITPYTSIRSFSNNIRIISLFIYFLITAIGIIAAVFISKKLYKPYSFMNDKIKDIENKSRNSFYLYKQDFLKELLNNSDSLSHVVILQKFKEFDIKLVEGGVLTLILFKIDRYNEFCNKYNFNDRNLLKFGISNIAAEICMEYYANETVDTNSDHVVLIVSTDNIEILRDICKKVHEAVLKFLEISCSSTISSTITSPEHLNKIYTEALETSKYRLFMGYGCIINPDDMALLKKVEFVYPEHKEKQLLDSFMLGKTNDAKRYYEEMILSLKDYSINTFIQTITRLALSFSITSGTLEKNNNSPSKFDFNGFISEFSSLETIEDINNIFIKFLDEMEDNNDEKMNRKHNKLIEDVTKIINEEYWDLNLSLESISDKVKVSSSHLRRIFKRITNQSLSDYLNEIRMNKAKLLLRNTSISVNEIAEKTGFLNSSYFFTAFKKINGITPNTYRQNGNE
jgi:two-component system, response regulator YesN